MKEVDTKILPSSTEEDDKEFILSDDEYELDEANTESLQVEPTEVEEKVKGLNISHWYSFTASMHGLWFQVVTTSTLNIHKYRHINQVAVLTCQPCDKILEASDIETPPLKYSPVLQWLVFQSLELFHCFPLEFV